MLRPEMLELEERDDVLAEIDGFAAFLSGNDDDANPHLDGSAMRDAWRRGWEEARCLME